MSQVTGKLFPRTSTPYPKKPTTSGSVVLVAANTWAGLVGTVNREAHYGAADSIEIVLENGSAPLSTASFVKSAAIRADSSQNHVIVGTISGVESVDGSFTLDSSATSPAFIPGASFSMTGTFKSDSSQPLVKVDQAGADVVINLIGATFQTGTGPVVKVEAANSVKILASVSEVQTNTIEAASGITVTVDRLGSNVTFASQSGIAGTLADGVRSEEAKNVGYTPSTPSDWTSSSINQVAEALDELRSVAGGGSSGAVKAVAYANSPYTVLSTEKTVLVDTTAGAVIINLPAKSAGHRLTVKDSAGTSASNPITIQPSGVGETIDGTANLVLEINHCAVSIVCDGSNWFAF